jgi:hypothetical protein
MGEEKRSQLHFWLGFSFSEKSSSSISYSE